MYTENETTTETFGFTYLTKDQFEDVKKVFIKSFNEEIKRFDSYGVKYLINKTISVFGVLKIHTLLRDDTIKSVVETIFNDSLLRDFILCLTDRFSCLTSVEDYADYKIARTMANSFSNGSELENIGNSSTNSLIPAKIADNLAMDKDTAEQVFITNRFYLVVAFIVLFIADTDAVDKDSNTGQKK